MKKQLFLFVVFVLMAINCLTGQNITATTYPFTKTASVSTVSITGTVLISSNVDEGASAVAPIGFDFWFDGAGYSTFSVESNGLIKLGNTVVVPEPVNDMASALNVPKITAYWDNLTTGLNQVKYANDGTSPNRRLIVEWYPNGKRVQTWLWESGKIEFVYGTAQTANANGYSIGIGNSGTDFASVTTTSVILNSTVAYGTANNSNTLGIAAFTKFSFTPVAPAAPTNLTFANITLNGMQLNWADASNELGYVIYQSLDNVNFTLAGQVAADVTSFDATGLNPGMIYYWKVCSFKEVLSTPLTGTQATTATPLAGTYTIGPSGDFSSLTTAIYTLNGSGFSAPGEVVFELMADYSSSVETFPLVIPATLPTTSANTLVLRPAADATGLSISSSAAQTIQINGADYVTIDGRPGGTGSAPELTIDNTLVAGSATTGIALQLINGASNNTIQYCNFTGVSTSTSGAVVSIYTSTAAAGNNNNLIDHCNIHDGASKPNILFVSAGTTAKENTGNIVSNNNFYNWQMGTSTGNGYAMTIGTNNTDMVVTGNSFYQTTPTTGITQSTNGFVSIGGANGTSFTNNYLGGSAPLCAGTPMSLTYQTYYGVVRGINLTPGALSPTSIQGNTIQNIEITAPSGQSASFTGIEQGSGVVNIGTITPNIIGSTSVPNSITVINNSSSAAASFYGITASGASYSTDQTNISNNVICGISLTGSGTNSANFGGISVSSWYTTNVYVTGNTIGSTTMANAITNSTPGTFTGISASSRNNSIITGNTIANLTSTNTATTVSQLIGINAAGGSSTVGTITVNNNTVFNLTSSSASTGTAGSASLIGISVSGTTGSRSVKGNTIYGLSNQNPTAVVNIAGISYSGTTSVNSPVAGNFIHSLSLASSETASSITGIYALNGNTSYYNNMIRLGIDATGTGITTGYAINGIRDEATTAAGNTNSFYHNTVYIGGTGLTGTTSNTFALNSTVVTNVTNIRNNILVNARSGGSTGKHYAIATGGTTPSPAGLTSSHNIFFVPGTGGTLGLFNATDRLTLADWQNATALDVLSAQTDPMLMLPEGSSTTLNLHVQASNPIEGSGVPLAAITDDFDGDVRSSNTPVDIGADAGNFTNSGDLFPPNIAFTPLLNTGLTTSPELSAEITDGVGVSTGANQPRIYFKKATDANAFAGNTSADNGWKYTHATVAASTYTFLLDYSILNGGSAAPGDVIQYFIVAQDDVNNFASAAPGATASSATNPVQNINGAPSIALVNSFMIINNNIAGTFTVPGNYPTLTGAGGLFEAINIGTVTGNFTVQITDNLVEPGTFALNQFASPFTMTIVPASASLKTITGNVNDGLIRFNGADNVTIDGRFGGSGNWLEFINTSTGTGATNCAMLFTNGATYNTVKYSTIKAQSGSGSVIYFYAIGTNTGNNSFNTIDHCNIDGSATKPQGVYSYYNTSGGEHVSNTISNCNIYDFTTNGISLSYGVSAWTISGNSFYQTSPRVQTAEINVIIMIVGANHLISGNYIGGSAPMAGGSPWTITGTGASFRAMYLYNTMSNFTVENNTITNININTTSSANSFYGIYLSLTTNGSVTGNTIGSTTAADAIVINRGVTSTDYGIYKLGATGTVPINGNSIGGITLSSGTTALSHSFQAITYTGSATTVNNNIIGSLTVPNSIHSSTASVSTTGQSITGISTSFPAGVCSVSGNTIANITNNYQGTVAAGTVRGISTSGVGSVAINGNTVSNLSNAAPLTGTGNAAAVIAIADNATGAAKVISNNMVTGLSSASASATVTGIYAGAGAGSYYNNVVNLGAGTDTGSSFTGIQDGAGTNTFYYNTVNLTGVVSGTTASTYAFNSITTGTRNYRNNVFVNTRSGGTGGTHYAVKVAGTAPGQANLTLNYNDYYVTGTALGFFNNLPVADLAAWQTAVGKDANSLSVDPLFTSATDLHTNETALNSGTPITGITLDFAGSLRNTVSPTMGAYETNCNNPTAGGVIAAAVITGCDPFDPDMITSTSLPSGNTGTLEYMWQQSTVSALTGFSDIANSNSETFDPGPLTINTWYKRLARVDCKGTWAGAAESNVIGFTVTSQPVSVSITASDNNVCAGTLVTFTALPVNGGDMPAYQWYKNGSPVSTASFYTYAPANNDQVYLELTSNLLPCGTGVTATSNTITMAVNPVISVSATIFPSANNVCEGTSVSYFAMVTNGGAAPVYQWKVNGTNVGTNANNYTYTPLHNDVVTCSVVPDVICPSANPVVSNSVTMTVYSTLVSEVSIAATSTVVCEGTEITFTATPVNGTSSPVYQWYKNGIATGTNSPTLTGLFANGDAVYVTLTVSPNPCIPSNIVTSNTITLTINPMPVLIITNPPQVTIPATADLTAPAVTAGSTPGLDVTYWQDAAATIPCATPTAVPVGTYYIKGLNTATGCYNIQPVHVTGLISYWHLDEAAGNIYADITGVNNGTGNLAPTAVTGQVNGAQQFNGTNTKIEVPANPTFDFAADGNFSVEFWYNRSNAPSVVKVAVGRSISGNTGWYVGINPGNGKVIFYMNDGLSSKFTYGPSITNGTWHHVSVTRNGITGISKVYVDGALKVTSNAIFINDFSSASAKLEIGSFKGGSRLDGNLDEVALHNVELTPEQIQDHFNKGTYGIGYYDNLAPEITSSALVNGTVNQLYSYDVDAIGYPAPTYSLITYPTGMTINNITGMIEWTPLSGGDFNVTVEASNGVNPIASQSFVISVPEPPVVPAGLVAYYKLDEASGNTYFDFTGINNGTGNLSPTAVTGQVNGAQQFNGTSTKIEVPANPTFDFAASENFSVEFWYKKSSAPSFVKVAVGRSISGNTGWYVGINPNSGKVIFYMNDGLSSKFTYGTSVTDGIWHHITVTRNGITGTSKVYVDGILKTTSNISFVNDFSSTTAKLEIGSFKGGSRLDGNLDEVAIHNVELTLTDIQQHYNNGLLGLGYFDPMAPIAMPLITETPEIDNSLTKLRAFAVNNDEIHVIGNVTGGSEAMLYDMFGNVVLFRKLEGSDLNIIPTEGLSTGIYILRVNDHGKIDTFKLLLKE